MKEWMIRSTGFLVAGVTAWVSSGPCEAQEFLMEIAGLVVTPHVQAKSMRYKRDPEPLTGARVQLFIRNACPSQEAPIRLDSQTRTLFAGKVPSEWLQSEDWAWHDTPSATEEQTLLLPESLTVWTFNGRKAPFGLNGRVQIDVGPEASPWLSEEIALDPPTCWLSAVTFLGPEESFRPDSLVVHIANQLENPVSVQSCRLWLPKEGQSPRVLFAGPWIETIQMFNGVPSIPGKDRGGFMVKTSPLPLTYAAVEVSLCEAGNKPFSIWGHLRIKTERFDISGGWVNGKGDPVANEIFLKTLKRLHVNTAHLGITPGYSDTELYDRYPLKYFGAMMPLETYDTDAMLPKIHAVEFLGEPQYGGGRPVPPQEVWTKLHPYATTRLATSVTHSEERVWRDYAGLSDFPHYDAYRITAPSADYWLRYDRWGGERIGWGAPLETIGDMCRSLREINRPMPCAIWSQGPADGWKKMDGRQRATPTPEEMRMQCYHALSTRITSLYWFNLSLKSLVQWRDTLGEMERIGRELGMLDEFLLEGDETYYARLTGPKEMMDWDVSVVAGPRAALLFALDLRYGPDPKEKVFRFEPARKTTWQFPVPAYLQGIQDVFRVDAEGIHEVKWSLKDGGVRIQDKASGAVLYVATPDETLRTTMEQTRQRLIQEEEALHFDPARNDEDFAQLKSLLESL